MKLTESQLRQFIKEAIEDTFNNFDDNDEFSEYDNMSDEELLINADADDINVDIDNDTSNIRIFIGNRELHIENLFFQAESKPKIGKDTYQLHIMLPQHLRQKGIMKKLYQAFLVDKGNICSLNSNRVGEYAKTVGKSENFDSAIDKTLERIANSIGANIEGLFDSATNKQIGVLVSL